MDKKLVKEMMNNIDTILNDHPELEFNGFGEVMQKDEFKGEIKKGFQIVFLFKNK